MLSCSGEFIPGNIFIVHEACIVLHWRWIEHRLDLFPAWWCRNHAFLGGFSRYSRGLQTRSSHHVKTWRHIANNNSIRHRIPSTYYNKLVEVCFAEGIYNNHCLAWRVLRFEIVLLKLSKESLNSWRALSNG